MDEQNPRLTAERVSGRVDEGTTGSDTTAVDPRTPESMRPYPTPPGPSGYTSATEPRTREIRAEIEQTREQMSETVDAIQERLRPGQLAANAAESVKQAARERVRDVAESDSVQYVRANPMPAAMIGIGIAGLAWLAFGGNEPRRYRGRSLGPFRDWNRRFADDRQRERTYSAYSSYGTANGYTPGLSSAESDTHFPYSMENEGPRDRGSRAMDADMTRAARDTGVRAQQAARRTWEDNPLLVGAASALLGAIVGAAIPETEREHELMGEARDNLVDSVQETVREKVSQVQEAATNAVGDVRDAARSAMDIGGGDSRSNDR
jgi:hypothetical protein